MCVEVTQLTLTGNNSADSTVFKAFILQSGFNSRTLRLVLRKNGNCLLGFLCRVPIVLGVRQFGHKCLYNTFLTTVIVMYGKYCNLQEVYRHIVLVRRQCTILFAWLKSMGTIHLAKYTCTLKNAKLKCSKIFTLQNRQIKMQLKYSVLQ